jgi:hypothetical protein
MIHYTVTDAVYIHFGRFLSCCDYSCRGVQVGMVLLRSIGAGVLRPFGNSELERRRNEMQDVIKKRRNFSPSEPSTFLASSLSL